MKKKIINFTIQVYSIIRKPVMSILPGQLAFSLVLAIIPILSLLGLIGFMFSISADSLSQFVNDTFPPATSSMLLPLIGGKGFDTNILLFLISAFFLASGGAYSIIVTSNILYEIEDRNEIKSRIKSYIITFILLLLMCFLIVVPGFGDHIIELLKHIEFIKPISGWLTLGFHILKYPLSLTLIYFNIKLIYTIAPNKTIESSTVNIGTLFTTILWIILTRIYSYYVSNVANYDIFYGGLSNIIILLFWMYLLSYIFVIGLALNAEKNRIKNQ